jgi:hypothetical protein
MTQETDNRRPLTAEVRVRCRPSQCEICGGRSGLGQDLLPASVSFHYFWAKPGNLPNTAVVDNGERWPEERSYAELLSCGQQQPQYRLLNLKPHTIRAVQNSKHETHNPIEPSAQFSLFQPQTMQVAHVVQHVTIIRPRSNCPRFMSRYNSSNHNMQHLQLSQAPETLHRAVPDTHARTHTK